MRMKSPSRDLVDNPAAFAVAWGLPMAILVGAIWLDHPFKTLLCGGSLTWMGIACLANASRCGRVHCHFTGPFYLLLAVLSVLHGYRILDWGERGWMWLGILVAGGTVLIWSASEVIAGRYFGGRSKREGSL